MKSFNIIFLILLITFILAPEASAQDLSINTRASYWGGGYWAGISARVQLTEEVSGRFSVQTSTSRYYRGSLEVIYDFPVQNVFDPYVGMGLGYSTHRNFNLDIIAGGRVSVGKTLRATGEVIYTIFFDPAYSNRVGLNLSMRAIKF